MQHFIPFKNQQGFIIRHADDYPEIRSHIDEHIQDLDIPIGFDYEQEIFKAGVKDREGTTGEFIDESYDRCVRDSKRLAQQRLVHLRPSNLECRKGVWGVNCDYLGAPDADLWIPKSVQMILIHPIVEYEPLDAEQRNVFRWCTFIVGFVVNPFDK